MKGWITSTVGERPYKAWAWHKSIFKDCDITFHATWQGAFDYLRNSGAMCIYDVHSGVSIITNNTGKGEVRRMGEGE